MTVFGGVLLSMFSLAEVIGYALENHPILIWSFFFGLIAASILYMCGVVQRWGWQEFVMLLLGTLVAFWLTSMKPATLPDTWWMMVFAGAIAICAMILPGISGSFLLLMMGMYSVFVSCLLYTSPSPRDKRQSRMPSSA